VGTSVYFNNQGATREQFLIEDMVIESIRNHGIDVYYIPRDSQSQFDELFGDDPVKSFTSAYKMEMYLETFNDFTGNQEFFSKFGLQIDKGVELALARRTFEKYVPYNLRNTPKEGDLIYLPVQQKLMEIKFVEQEKNFFQLGRSTSKASGGLENKIMPYMYGLSLESFKYNGELLATGVPVIDGVADQNAFNVEYTMQPGGTLTYKSGEIVYQGSSLATSSAKAYVRDWNKVTNKLTLRNIKGSFVANTVVKGQTSNAQWTLLTGDTQEDSSETYDDNIRIENEADNFLDFSETNPFGES
jgi:hypothetical protein